MNPIKRGVSALMRNPWLPLFIGIPFLAIAWGGTKYVLPPGENYYGLYALSISAALIGSALLGISIFRGDTVIRILAVLFLLSNFRIATEWINLEPWRPRTLTYPIPPPKISVIDSRPRIDIDEGSLRIVLGDAAPEMAIFSCRVPSGLLAEDQSYRFTIEETPVPLGVAVEPSENGMVTAIGQRHPAEPLAFMWIPEIVTIERGGSVIFDRAVCEVHHERMERRDLPIRYGYPHIRSLPPPSEEAARFPHGIEYILGGCCVIEGMDTSKGFVCSTCLEAFKKWEAENPRPVK